MKKINANFTTKFWYVFPIILTFVLLNRVEATPLPAGTDYWSLSETNGLELTLGAYGDIIFDNNFIGTSPNTSQSYSMVFERLNDSTLEGGAGCAGPVDPAEPFCAVIEEIPIIMREFSLQSMKPVDIGGMNYNVFLELDPDQDTIGQLDLQHKFTDGENPAYDGINLGYIWEDLFLRAEFNEVGGSDSFLINGNVENIVYDFERTWSHSVDGGFDTGSASWAPQGPGSFSINETVGVIQVDSVVTRVPEPGSLALLCLAFTALGFINISKNKKTS